MTLKKRHTESKDDQPVQHPHWSGKHGWCGECGSPDRYIYAGHLNCAQCGTKVPVTQGQS